MVTFDVPPSDFESSERHMDDDHGEKKQIYRITPHPSSKARGRNEDESDRSINDYVSNVPSPEQDGRIPSEEESEWNHWLDTLQEPSNIPNLHGYLAAKAAREEAQRTFDTALDECLDRMTHAMTEELLADSVGVVHQEQGERFESLEASIVEAIKSNHFRRIKLNENTEEANSKWCRQYKRLRANIWDEDSTNEQDVESSEDRTNPMPTDETIAMEAGNDPNWAEIVQFAPARKTVTAFLAAREKLRDADDALSQSLDEIHSGLKEDADAIIQIVIEFYNQFENESLSLEQDIQHHLMSNGQRRDAFQSSLQESAKQAQGLIDNLLSRLTSGR